MGRVVVVEHDVWPLSSLGRIVGQGRVLADQWTTSMRKPSMPRSSQKRSDVVHRLHDLGIAPVEVGLLGEEAVQVVLAGRSIEGPRRRPPVKAALQLLGGSAVGRGVAPDVPVALRVRSRRAALDEPRVLRRGVVGHPVEQHVASRGRGPRRGGGRGRRACRTAGRRRSSRRRRSRSRPSGSGRTATARRRRPRARRGGRAGGGCPRGRRRRRRWRRRTSGDRSGRRPRTATKALPWACDDRPDRSWSTGLCGDEIRRRDIRPEAPHGRYTGPPIVASARGARP